MSRENTGLKAQGFPPGHKQMTLGLSGTEALIAKLILAVNDGSEKNPLTTYSGIVNAIGKKHNTESVYILRMKKEYNLIERVCSDKNGFWKKLHENFKGAGQ